MEEFPQDEAEVERMDEALRAFWQGETKKLESLLDEDETLSQIGNYRVIRKIASGGMGAVYEVEQQNPNRRLALKTINPFQVSPTAVRRFLLEAEILGRLRHPGIAEIIEAGSFDSNGATQPFFVMELVRGLDLASFAERHALNLRQRVELFAKVCDAAQYAHLKGVIHRDLKPDNIFVDEFGQPKILDFGVARLKRSAISREALSTLPGVLIGTMDYMSPEQLARNPLDLDARSDVYALGVILFQLLSGQLPYDLQEKTLPEKSRIICERDSKSLASLNKACRGDLERIVAKALEKDPGSRYQSAADLGADLRRFLKGERPLVEAPTALGQFRRFVLRHKAPVIAASAVFLAITIGFAVSTRLYLLADERLANFNRLADVNDLETLKEQARRISSEPGSVDLLKSWVERAENLISHLPTHRSVLLALRERALSYTEELRERNRKTHARYAELDDMIRYRKYMESKLAEGVRWGATEDPNIPLEEQLDKKRKQIAALESEIEERRLWQFSDPQDQWQHEVLTKLVKDLERFADPEKGTLGRVKGRLEFAKSSVRRTVNEHLEAWKVAISSIADMEACPKYNGLHIQAQPGLIPIGRDPSSGLWEFAHLETGEIPKKDEAGRILRDEAMGLVFVLIPGGSFTMGIDPVLKKEIAERSHISQEFLSWELRPHVITLNPFFISKFEMTQAQWKRIAGDNPSTTSPLHSNWPGDKPSLLNPVETVSWFEADDLLSRLGLCLPTDAQWEYAARAGTTALWWTGESKESLTGAANIGDVVFGEQTLGAVFESWMNDGYARHAPVGSFAANPFGLHDVYGNVQEWCYDGLGPKELPVSPGNGLRVGGEGGAGYRICRGGSFNNWSDICRSGFVGALKPELREEYTGLRPAKALHP